MAAVRPSLKNQLRYRDRLQPVVLLARHLGEDVLSDVAGAGWKRRGFDVAVLDSDPAHLDIALARARRRAQRYVVELAAEVAGDVTRVNLRTVDARLARSVHASIGIDIGRYLELTDIDGSPLPALGHAMEKAREANVSLIKSIPEEHLARVGKAIEDHWRKGGRWESLVERIEELGEVAKNRATLIARDQTSKMNAAFNQVRQTSIGIRRYEWLTAHDERVRSSHRAMDRVICSWDAPPLVDGEHVHAGEAVNCRCAALPVFDLGTAAGSGALEYAEAA